MLLVGCRGIETVCELEQERLKVLNVYLGVAATDSLSDIYIHTLVHALIPFPNEQHHPPHDTLMVAQRHFSAGTIIFTDGQILSMVLLYKIMWLWNSLSPVPP